MTETVVTIEDAARRLPDLIESVRAKGESALIVKSGLPLARIVPARLQNHRVDELLAFLHRWRVEHPDPDEQFAEVIEDSRKAIRPPHDPWA